MRPDVFRWGLTILLLFGTATTAKVIDQRSDEPLTMALETIPSTVGPWTAEEDPPLSEPILEVLAPTSYISRTYHAGDRRMNLFIAYYANQRAGESMHSPKHCLPGAGWEITNYGVTDIPLAEGAVQVNHHTIQKDGNRMAVIYWYQSKRRIIADEYAAKLYLVRDAIMERRTGGSIVRIICDDDPAEIKAAIEFGRTIIPEVHRCMTGERGAATK